MAGQLSTEQDLALQHLRSGDNVFVTGGAGSGKSFLIRHFLREIDTSKMPILASTGAAAVLLGGRTFHSFFGLGIMEGGATATLERAQRDGKLMARMRKIEGVVIDEISMISGEAFQAAEIIARMARATVHPWGGLRIIVVGDFAQLPPVTKFGQRRDWCFLSGIWETTNFNCVTLSHNQRVQDDSFLDVLNDVRRGLLSGRVKEFLDLHLREFSQDESDNGVHLLPRRDQAETFNLKKLSEIPSEEVVIDSIYFGAEKFIQALMKLAPVPLKLVLKKKCKVMLIQNDPTRRWVNGTTGFVEEITPDKIFIRKNNGVMIQVEKSSFSIQDADGNSVATVIQFPIILAYATTIHKSQGSTLDSLWCDLSNLWEAGQAYVALSRLRTAEGLKLLRWSSKSFIVDKDVVQFYKLRT